MSAETITGGTIQEAVHNVFRGKTETVTLGADKVLTTLSPMLQFLNNGGAVRDLTLPAEADSAGLMFIIKNVTGGAFAITVKDDAAGTIASLLETESCIVMCDGTTWEGVSVGGET